MSSWKAPSFMLLWDMQPIGKVQVGFFQTPEYSKPEYYSLKHTDDLVAITKIIEENITVIDLNTRKEASDYAESANLAFIGGRSDYDNYWSYRFRATVHGTPDDIWMTDLVNGKLTGLLRSYS